VFDLNEVLPNHTQLSKFFSFSLATAVLFLEIDFSVEGLPKIGVTVQQDLGEKIVVNVSTNETLQVHKGRVSVGPMGSTHTVNVFDGMEREE
jgi:hypothetical protein